MLDNGGLTQAPQIIDPPAGRLTASTNHQPTASLLDIQGNGQTLTTHASKDYMRLSKLSANHPNSALQAPEIEFAALEQKWMHAAQTPSSETAVRSMRTFDAHRHDDIRTQPGNAMHAQTMATLPRPVRSGEPGKLRAAKAHPSRSCRALNLILAIATATGCDGLIAVSKRPCSFFPRRSAQSDGATRANGFATSSAKLPPNYNAFFYALMASNVDIDGLSATEA